jgi:hypothetical protein
VCDCFVVLMSSVVVRKPDVNALWALRGFHLPVLRVTEEHKTSSHLSQTPEKPPVCVGEQEKNPREKPSIVLTYPSPYTSLSNTQTKHWCPS